MVGIGLVGMLILAVLVVGAVAVALVVYFSFRKPPEWGSIRIPPLSAGSGGRP